MEAARGVFADLGYERATIRVIATAAGADKSSVIQYFGTKQNLFREAVHWTVPAVAAVGDSADQTAENLARGMFAAWSAKPNSPMTVLLRASMTSEDAAEVLRTHITTEATPALAGVIDAPDARLRAALLGAMLMGVASQRYLLGMPDLCDVDTEKILAVLTPALRALIAPSETSNADDERCAR
ncbi:TetR family transcriptional regulator [Mycobacterium sp. M1]|uniref:TetR family transcriptional regulator n=1 Tax=Mycolicibacter acidiphilus TaxID=2835306 RepID=A0ABS5RJ22_9MYCO|nr:TetR family transcriptional regulator [Mycolicibacter acidiphilus]MBS9534260.1 TetR family transcriptional regulator [Mycolicibacter acidiphilus]